MDVEWPLAAVKVSGFPSTMNQYQLAAIFYNFNVNSVHLEGDGAVICFANKFHAVQAALMFDGVQLDSEHILKLTPIHDVLKEQFNIGRAMAT